MEHYLILSTLLFSIGLFGIVLNRKNILIVIFKEIFPVLIFWTVFNFLCLYIFEDIFFFLYRQIFLVVGGFTVGYIKIQYKELFLLFLSENRHIEDVFKLQYPILNLYIPLLVLSVVGLYFNILKGEDPEYDVYCRIFVYLQVSFLVISFLKIFYSVTTPEIASYYNLPKAIKTGGVRSFGTAKVLLHYCKFCGYGIAGCFVGDGAYAYLSTGDPDSMGVIPTQAALRSQKFSSRTFSGMRNALICKDRLPPEEFNKLLDWDLTNKRSVANAARIEKVMRDKLKIEPFGPSSFRPHISTEHKIGWDFSVLKAFKNMFGKKPD